MKNLLIVISLFIFSCEAPIKKTNQVHEKSTIDKIVETEESEGQEVESIEPSNISNSVRINLGDFKVILLDYLCYNSEYLENYKSDTIPLDEEVGFNLDSQLLRIVPKSNDDKFEVYVAFEQDLRVYVGEKQVIDLEKWHIQDSFVKIPDSAQYFFRLPSYNTKEKEQRLSNYFEQIKEDVLKIDGEYIDSTLDNVTDLNKLPIEFWISKVLIKIVYIDANSNQRTFLLKNQSSWGC